MITAYRPDAVVDPEFSGFTTNLAQFGALTGEDCSTWTGYLAAHRKRRAYFIGFGATSSDHGHPTAATANLSASEAAALFKQAFADGRGDIGALIPLARLVDYKPRLREANRAYFRQALERFATGRDFIAVDTRLEVFLVYPELFQQAEVARLIELYDRACLIYCHAPLYRAVAAARYGERSEAEKWFQLAVESDPRAVQRYYEFLGEQRNVLFRAFAERLAPRMNALPIDLVHRIAQQGLLVSEYPPGVRPARHRFLTRNRIVAAPPGTLGQMIMRASPSGKRLRAAARIAGQSAATAFTGTGGLACHAATSLAGDSGPSTACPSGFSTVRWQCVALQPPAHTGLPEAVSQVLAVRDLISSPHVTLLLASASLEDGTSRDQVQAQVFVPTLAPAPHPPNPAAVVLNGCALANNPATYPAASSGNTPNATRVCPGGLNTACTPSAWASVLGDTTPEQIRAWSEAQERNGLSALSQPARSVYWVDSPSTWSQSVGTPEAPVLLVFSGQACSQRCPDNDR